MQRLLVTALLFTTLAINSAEQSPPHRSCLHTRYANSPRLPYSSRASAFNSTVSAQQPGTTRKKRNMAIAALAMQGNLLLLQDLRRRNRNS